MGQKISELLEQRAELFKKCSEANKAGEEKLAIDLLKRLEKVDLEIRLNDLEARNTIEDGYDHSFVSLRKDQIGHDFVKHALNAESRTDVTSTTGAGAIPSFTSTDAWLASLGKIPFIRQSGMQVISPPNNTKYPFATDPTVYFQSAEGDAITPSGTTITSKDINYRTWGCLVKVSYQALRDGGTLLTNIVQNTIMKAAGDTISRVVLSGNGSQEPLGLDDVSGIQSIDVSGGTLSDWSTFNNALSKVHGEGVDPVNVACIGGTNVMKQVQNFDDSTGQFLSPPPIIGSVPFVYTNAVLENYSSKTRYYLGDFSNVIVATSGPFMLNLSQRYGNELMAAILVWGGLEVLVQRPQEICIVKNIALA